jgi:L-malate glycosyltransferase
MRLELRPDVVHVLPHAHPLGGAERYALDLLESPMLAHIDQRIVFLRGGPLGPFPREAVLPMRRIASLKPRVLHGWLLRGNAFATVASTVLPRSAVLTSEQNLGHNLTSSKRLVECLVASLEDCCIANSSAVADAAIARIPSRRDRIRVIRPGISPPSTSGPRRWASCVAVGRLEPVKDHETLIRAWAIVRRRFSEATLVVVGEGPERGRLERLVTDLGLDDAVSLPGMADPFPLLRGSDIYASTSRAEGFSRALLEAMALGRPIVTTAVGGAPELPDGTVGLIPVGDPYATSGAICSLLVDAEAAARMGAAAREEYERSYTLEHSHAAYRDLYAAWLA